MTHKVHLADSENYLSYFYVTVQEYFRIGGVLLPTCRFPLKSSLSTSSSCRFYGSAFLRCLPFAVLSGAETALLYVFWGEEDKSAWRHPYPYALSAFIVGFVVVYRYRVLFLIGTYQASYGSLV